MFIFVLMNTCLLYTSASPVTIYRTIARVYLNQLFLSPLEEYSNGASFKLESVFMANVKNYSRYISTEDWGAVEVSDPSLPDFFLTGACLLYTSP